MASMLYAHLPSVVGVVGAGQMGIGEQRRPERRGPAYIHVCAARHVSRNPPHGPPASAVPLLPLVMLHALAIRLLACPQLISALPPCHGSCL